jgi:hypothetical protein
MDRLEGRIELSIIAAREDRPCPGKNCTKNADPLTLINGMPACGITLQEKEISFRASNKAFEARPVHLLQAPSRNGGTGLDPRSKMFADLGREK